MVDCLTGCCVYIDQSRSEVRVTDETNSEIEEAM
jgi:hypothetical protein